MSNILKIAGAGGAAEETDENFNQTVLLLHGDGTNGAQNNTFLDSSTNNFTITRNGNTTQGTFSPFSQPDGRWSNFLDGSGDYFTFAQSSDFNLTGDFCVQAWAIITVDPSGVSGYYPRLCAIGDYNSANNFHIELNDSAGTGTRGLYPCIRINTSITDIPDAQCSNTPLVLNAWTHICLVRSGTNVSLYLNGTRTANFTNSGTTSFAGPLFVGAMTGGVNTWTGSISNFSIVNGSSIFDPSQTTITVPTSPLSTSTTNQKLLTCYGNRFADFNTATTAKTITVNGNPKVTPFSPFAPTAAYDPAVNGGSAYLDGTGDYLDAGDNAAFELGSGNFCIQAWIYPTSTTEETIISKWTAAGTAGSNSWLLFINAGALAFFTSTNGSAIDVNISGGTVSANAWSHVAICRSGNNYGLFLNGTRVADTSNGNALYDTATTVKIGRYSGGVLGEFNGYVSSLQLVKGSAVYDPTASTLTIPTAPPTNITNTSLLLNFTNAGIFDNTGKNNLETVGNAQIDTTVKKYGTGAIQFDGTGDYLLAPTSSNDLFNFGTGNFTVEMWFYANSLSASSYAALCGCNSDASLSEWGAYVRSNGIFFFGAAGTLTGAGTISTGTWYHYAAVRNGNTISVYLDGTLVDSDDVTGDSYINSSVGFRVGDDPGGSNPAFNGYIDDLRITKGVARYTTDFSSNLPTKAFPDL